MKFKDILGWLKSNLAIVIFVALIVISLPVAAFFSTSWLKRVLSKQQSAASNQLTQVRGAEITYQLRQFDPAVDGVSKKDAPNEALIRHFAAANEAGAAQAEQIAQQGENFNRGVGPAAESVGRTAHAPLIEGIFPRVAMPREAASNPSARRDREQEMLNTFEDALLGKRGRPDPYVQLLASLNAGQPPEGAALESLLRDFTQRETEKITQGARQATEAERVRVSEAARERLLAELSGRSRQLGVYASPAIFGASDAGRGGATGSGQGAASAYSQIPLESVPTADLTVPRLFLHQWDLWFLQDLFTAVRLVNFGPDGKAQGVDRAVVKRIISVRLLQPEGIKAIEATSAEVDPLAMPAEEEAAPTSSQPGMVPLDPRVSLTGRARGGWNEKYEVRRAQLELIVSSARLPELLEAFPKVNYMTVTNLSGDVVQVWEDLRAGYYYGEEHVMRVRIDVESVWLKSWMIPLMPRDLQTALGMTPPPEEEETPADGEEGPR